MAKAIALCGMVALGALLLPLRPADAELGQAVSADEAESIIGGTCAQFEEFDCSELGSTCSAAEGWHNVTYSSLGKKPITGSACNLNCVIWKIDVDKTCAD